jgi:hypothetical protein
MRVEMTVDLGAKHRGKRDSHEERRDTHRPARHDKHLRWLALGLHIETIIGSGELENYAEAARRCGVSRARICKLVAPLLNDL